ncbi:MAG: MutS-related protein [Aequorivita sp.]
MTNPSDFYKSQIEKHSETLKSIKLKLAISSGLRILVFIVACVTIFFALDTGKNEIALVVLIVIATLVLFVLLVSKHNQLKYQWNLNKSITDQNETELRVLNRDFHHLPSGEKYKNPLHFYSQDIDLFGRGSFYQYMNRTALDSGSDLLANLLTENDINDIAKKQEAIKEIAQNPEWRQRFSGIASQVKTQVPATEVANWLENYQNFVPKWVKPVSVVFSMVSLGLFVGNYFELISGYFTLIWLFVGWTISGIYSKKIKNLTKQTSKVQSTFEQFHKLVLEIENQEFSTEILAKKRNDIISSTAKTSSIIKKFAKNLDGLEQGNIMIFGQLFDGFMMWNLRKSYNIEQWIDDHKAQVPIWFETISFYDAYSSLGNFAFNHPKYIYPTLTNDTAVLNVKDAGHPLLKEETMVLNDIYINSEEFFIVTGANMAGKSTFLRTVSLQIVMGNVGLPVCAEKAEYNPIKLITSMRTTDSLTDNESYFFSELKRLKFIVDEIKTDKYFIILDEILKGTNSTDKAIGSRKFIEKLVNSNSTGIIATHDLSLCSAADDMPEVKNHYFDAEIIDGELFFDYTMKPGICQNMNASFLLKKMEIVD